MAKTKYDIDKAYVSPIDVFLARFDYSHKKSASQKQEIKKHERIFKLRDNPNAASEETAIWEKF